MRKMLELKVRRLLYIAPIIKISSHLRNSEFPARLYGIHDNRSRVSTDRFFFLYTYYKNLQ